MTGHNEVVLVVFDPKQISYDELLKMFWESHDPTQGMRQGNDVGTQYRSGIYYFDDAQREAAEARATPTRRSSKPPATVRSPPRSAGAASSIYAEDYHQQYLAKNPGRLLRARRHRRHLPGRAGSPLTLFFFFFFFFFFF